MVSEAAALLGSEDLFAAGIKDAVNRKTGRRPLRTAIGEAARRTQCRACNTLGEDKTRW